MRTAVSLRERVAARTWYHKIELGSGIVTSGLPFDHLWDMVRKLKRHADYTNKRVLDLGSWDGMWAFEAERHGAGFVVATDIYPYAYENFLLCREALGSSVQPFYNTSVYDLRSHLATLIYDCKAVEPIEAKLFDIVQNFGVMYHVRDPMYALASCRSALKTGGLLILETAAILDDEQSLMVLNGYPKEPRIYKDPTTWWAMTVPCLEEMLAASLFRPRMETVELLYQDKMDGRTIGRVGLIAEAVAPTEDLGLPATLIDEFMQPFRTPGVALDHYRGRS
jgi:SAM-dependent methyltransferase